MSWVLDALTEINNRRCPHGNALPAVAIGARFIRPNKHNRRPSQHSVRHSRTRSRSLALFSATLAPH